MLRNLGINIFIFFGLLLIIEVAGQLVFVIKNKRLLFSNPNKAREELFLHHPYLSVAMNKNRSVTFEKDKQYLETVTTEIGTRWTGADLNDDKKIRIACLGGSTTFCTGVEDQSSWPALLQKKLGEEYAVINYGVPAYTTIESIIQLALYVPELMPDLVIFFQGGNDMYNYHQENSYPDYFWHGEIAMPAALLGTKKYETCFEKLKKKSGLFYIIGSISEKFQAVEMPERFDVPDTKIDSLYVRNMRSQLALVSSWNKPAFFIGQIFNPHHEKKEQPWSILIQSQHIIPMMDRVNGLTKAVCSTAENCRYLDLKNAVEWQPEHFWDDMHFTHEGNELFSDLLSDEIKKLTVSN